MENYRDADLYELSELAGDGDYAAAMELARRFREGDGVEPDQDRAESWLRHAMSLRDDGDESAPEPQPQGAASAAETPDNKAGHGWTPTAQLKGLTIGQLREEATRGNPFAMSLQGQKYLASRSMEEKKLGLSALEKAIDIGKRNLSGGDGELVQMMLRDYLAMGHCYEELARSTGDESCNAKALECYGNAQELDPNEVTDLLRCYEEGIGCRPDRKEILRLREKLAETGGILPRFQLAEAYYEDEQHMRASEWYQIALESGDAQAHPAAADICRIRLRELDADGQTDALSAAMDKDALWEKTVNGDALAAWFYANNLAQTADERETALRYGQDGTDEPYAGMCRAALEEADRQRQAAVEAERRRLLEEAKRRRQAAEEAKRRRLLEEAERHRQAAEGAERQRQAAEEAERRRQLAEAEAERRRQLAEAEAERQRKAEAERQRENEQKKKDRFKKLVAAAALLLLVLIYAAVSNHNAPANTAFRAYSAGNTQKASEILNSKIYGNSKQEKALTAKVEKELSTITGRYEKGTIDAASLRRQLDKLMSIASNSEVRKIQAYLAAVDLYEEAKSAAPTKEGRSARQEAIARDFVDRVTDQVNSLRLADNYGFAADLALQAQALLPKNDALEALYSGVKPTKLSEVQYVLERKPNMYFTETAVKDFFGTFHGPDNCLVKGGDYPEEICIMLDRSFTYLSGGIAPCEAYSVEDYLGVTIYDGNKNLLYNYETDMLERPFTISLDVTDVDMLVIRAWGAASILDNFCFYR